MRLIPCSKPADITPAGQLFEAASGARIQRYVNPDGDVFERVLYFGEPDQWYHLDESDEPTIVVHMPMTRWEWLSAGLIAGAGAAAGIAILILGT